MAVILAMYRTLCDQDLVGPLSQREHTGMVDSTTETSLSAGTLPQVVFHK